MKNLFLLNLVLCLFAITVSAQTEDDVYFAANLKKQFPDERFGASELLEEYRFDKGFGLDNQPVVTVTGRNSVTFVALRDGASFPYYQYYNGFVSLKNFDYYYRNKKEKFTRASIKAIDKPMTDDGIFLDDNRIKYYPVYLHEFGEAARFEFTEFYSDSKYFTRLYFHQPFAIKNHKIKLVIPIWLELDIREMNFEGFKVEKQKTIEGEQAVITYSLQNVEPVPQEDNAAGWAFQWPHLVITVKKWDDYGKTNTGFAGTGDLYKWYKKLYNKCQNKPEYLKPTVNQIIADKTSPDAKARAIYYWVQDNIRYIAFEDGYAGFIPTPAQDVLKNKYGDCKGMANLLTEMLKVAGLQANYALVGTRQIPYNHHTVNAMCVDNHAISCLYLQGKPMLLDATEKYGVFGEIAYRISGKTALVERKDSFEIVDIPAPVPEKHKAKTEAVFTIGQNRELTGKITYTLTGEMRTQFNQTYFRVPSNRREDFMKNVMDFGNENLEVKTAKMMNTGGRDSPVVIVAEVNFNHQLTKIESEWFAAMDFYPSWLKGYTPQPNRKRFIDLEMIGTFEHDIVLNLPNGFTIHDKPATVTVNEPGYTFSGEYAVSKQKVALKKLLVIKDPIITGAQFEKWRGFLFEVKKFNNNLISATANL